MDADSPVSADLVLCSLCPHQALARRLVTAALRARERDLGGLAYRPPRHCARENE